MRLCFGIFASLLNQCRYNTLQAPLIARIVAVVDPGSRYIGENKFEIQKQLQKYGKIQDGTKFIGDSPMSTKLLNCSQNFIFTDGKDTNIPTQNEVINRFENIVAPFIDENKKPMIILALLHIIKQDEYIDFEKKESFKKYLGKNKQDLLLQNEFIFSDFLGKILLYTVCGNVDNTVGKEYVKEITCNYIDDIAKHYIYEFQWNSDTQTFTFLPFIMFSIFQQAIKNYEIDIFINEIDPTNRMDIKWIEQCEEFIHFIDKNPNFSCKNLEKQSGLTFKKIFQFCQILNTYTDYLMSNMRPLIYYSNNNNSNNVTTFVPICRYENKANFQTFRTKVLNYREQIISIYEELCCHIKFE